MQSFDDISVATKTFTAATNISINNLEELFNVLDVIDYAPSVVKTVNSVSCMVPNTYLKNGDIVTLKYRNLIKGYNFKKRRETANIPFRNSFTVVMYVLDKLINFKIYSNGKFQMTGCKTKTHAILCVHNFWKIVKPIEGAYTFKHAKNTRLKVFFIPAMRNIDFNNDYIVDQEKLVMFMSCQPDFYCLLDTNFGYTGSNIKKKLDMSISDMTIIKMSENAQEGMGTYAFSRVMFTKYLDKMPEKAKEKKLDIRYNTFLIFHSGRIIMSGINAFFMRKAYYEFVGLMKDNRVEIEEKLTTGKIEIF